MKQEKYTVGCKINLNLYIVNRRENGYHELDSLFYPLKNPHDTIIIHEYLDDNSSNFSLTCNINEIDKKNNILTKLYTLFKERTYFAPTIQLELQKGIPHGAGLGGGSADAAFFLKYLYAKWRNISFSQNFLPENKDLKMLEEIALAVGADVPFFLHNSPMRAQGVGEVLSPLNVDILNNFTILLVCPKIQVNTKDAFNKFKEKNQILIEKIKNNTSKSLTRALKKDINSHEATNKAFFKNDLESSVFSSFPILKDYKEKLLNFDAVVALMSGSGSSLFALFETKEQAKKAKAFFENLEGIKLCIIVG